MGIPEVKFLLLRPSFIVLVFKITGSKGHPSSPGEDEEKGEKKDLLGERASPVVVAGRIAARA